VQKTVLPRALALTLIICAFPAAAAERLINPGSVEIGVGASFTPTYITTNNSLIKEYPSPSLFVDWSASSFLLGVELQARGFAPDNAFFSRFSSEPASGT
jgi:hypothetical protein